MKTTETKFKEDLLLIATLGETTYNEIKKYLSSWRSEYLQKQAQCSSMNWNDFLTMKIAEQKNMIDWNVYEGTKKVGTTKALNQQDAVNKFAPFFKKDELTARRSSTMTFN
jgi:hypothetical protein